MTDMLSITGLSKVYNDGLVALDDISLNVSEGEILALLGPNGAGKTTLISAVCGLVVPTKGKITVGGFDTRSNYRLARSLIGLVPQEISLEPFEKVINTVRFSRGLFGKNTNDNCVERVLRQLSLWDKKDSKIMQLSGGMKRRVLIAKALAHEPKVLFLDEPSAGVDVELRREMWKLVADLKSQGVTIILTTHYIEEAEAIADRVGVISKGKLILLEEKKALMSRMGQKKLQISLQSPIDIIPEQTAKFEVIPFR
jgi:ABC-2 type transport system ATP-binding protein